MIDYFTQEELTNLQYLIISASVRNQGTSPNVVKVNDLFPSTNGVIIPYVELGDKKLMHKMYYKELKDMDNIIYSAIIDPILRHHHNIVLLCDENEDVYMDVVCDYLEKSFGMKVIDLNRLFKEGETDIFFIDKSEIKNKSVELKRSAVMSQIESLEKSASGREKLLGLMNKEDKLKKLKELGINVNKSDNKHLTELLRIEWVNADD